MPSWQELEGKSVQELLTGYPFWPHLTDDERHRRYRLCTDIRDGVITHPEDEYFAIASLAAMRLDVQAGVYESFLYEDVLADYWYGPEFAAVPGLEDIDFEAAGDFCDWVGELADDDTPPWFLAKAATTSDQNERLLVLRNPHTPPLVLAAFANWGIGTEDGGNAAFYVAMNPSTPDWALETVARRAPSSALEQEWFGDDHLHVALLNPNCPLSLLETASTNENVSTRRTVAHSIAAPNEILLRLTEDADDEIAAAARRNPMLITTDG
jgi:hypothetical protein